MPLASLGFLVGVLVCQSLTELPMREWAFLLIIFIPLVFRFSGSRPEYRFVLFLILGFLYSVLIAHSKLGHQISPEIEARDLLITGVIASISKKSSQRARFWLEVNDLSELPTTTNSKSGLALDENLEAHFEEHNIPRRVQLSWYKDSPNLSVGQHWQLTVRLKRPRGFSNPGAFDYESWLYQNNIDATGYVRTNKQNARWNKLLGVEAGPITKLHHLREWLSLKISEALENSAHSSLITALVVGNREQMTNDQWATLTKTGTNHLMAISGLHIGLIAGLIFYLSNRVWRWIPRASLYIAAPRIAALCAIVAALLYASLAGFTLPTQRAFIMISVAMLAVWFQRPLVSSQVLAASLLAVLLFDPTSVLNGSFWLSFSAVAVIVFTMSNRLPLQPGIQKWWWKWGRVQWVITIGLAPILLFWFQQVPLLSPVANFIAVPVVSLFTVPLSLLGGICLLIAPTLGQIILSLASFSLDLVWPILDSMARADDLLFKSSKPPLWTLVPASIGILLLLAPKGLPARWLGVVWLLPLVFYAKSDIPYGSYRFTLLDVGQGLAAVVQTQHHTMLYDTGPRYSESFNAGDAAVIPYLTSAGINRIDQLILSHDDIDHTGGYEAVIARKQVTQLTVSPGMTKNHPKVEICETGKEWDWDGVQFKILHPVTGYQNPRDNNKSCVVQITTKNAKLLLTGDMESQVETHLVKFFAKDDDNFRADVVVVPHHGSRSSSSEGFVRALNPEYALVSAGYMNRYGLPKADVVARYQAVGAQVLNTSHDGAISFLMDKNGLSELSLHRKVARRYWSSVTN